MSTDDIGKKITLFLREGFSRGIKGVNIDQWSGKCVSAPREKIGEVIADYPELKNACLYFLLHF